MKDERIGDYVVRKEDERPARPDGTCFYCGEAIGGRHQQDCVVPQRWARVRFTVELDVAVPAFWTQENVEFHYNEGSWCADNLRILLDRAINRLNDAGTCLCNDCQAEPVELEMPRPDGR